MPLQSRTGYSAMQIALHWLIAALVLFQLIFGEAMQKYVDAAEEGDVLSPTDQAMGSAHYWVGISILALVAMRLVLRFGRGVPAPAQGRRDWMETAALISHFAFYLMLVSVPIMGLLGYYYGDPWGEIHAWNKPVFIALIAIHSAAALFHQFWLKDGTLRRMLRPA